MYPFTVQLPYVNGYVSILIHGYIINRYTPPASARITPFISNSNSNALIRFTGMLVSITNVLICNPSGILPSRFTIRSSSSLKSGNNSRCTVFSVLGLLSHPMAFTKSSADVISTAWFFLIRLLQNRNDRSRSNSAKIKINFPLNMARACGGHFKSSNCTLNRRYPRHAAHRKIL